MLSKRSRASGDVNDTLVERGTAKVKGLTQEHNTLHIAPARVPIRTVESGDKYNNHKVTAPLQSIVYMYMYFSAFSLVWFS